MFNPFLGNEDIVLKRLIFHKTNPYGTIIINKIE